MALSFALDRFGNRWQQNGPISFLATFTGNQPSNPQNNNRVDGYGYDAAGNMTSDGFHSYFYDAENRLVQVDGTAGYCANGSGTAATACYIYDAFGRRVHKTASSNECTSYLSGYTDYLYDLSDRALIFTSNGVNQCHDEIYAGNRHLVSYLGGNTHYNLSDWLGTERVRAYGTYIDETCTGLPFGDGLSCTRKDPDNPYESPLHFTGKERDRETAAPFGAANGLDYFGARYDSSRMGRFMSPDPLLITKRKFVDPQEWNLYSYVRDNPLTLTDPTGLYTVDCSQGTDKEQKKCNKAANNFEKQRQKDLKSKSAKVRAAAQSWGDPGENNHIIVTFKTQAQVDADAGNTDTQHHRVDAIVRPIKGTVDDDPHIEAEFSEGRGGSDLAQTISHEGSHVEDITNFFASYNPETGKFSPYLNQTIFDTEFQAFEAGSMVKSYSFFRTGPKGYQQLTNYIYSTYRYADELLFPSSEFPQ